MPFRDVFVQLEKIYLDLCGTSCNTLFCELQFTLYLTHAQRAVDPSLPITVLYIRCLGCGTAPGSIVVCRTALPRRQTFLHKNIPHSANLLLHLSGSHLATHKLQYSFLPYLVPTYFFFSLVFESMQLQTLRILLGFSLTIHFHLFLFLQWPKLPHNCQEHLAT